MALQTLQRELLSRVFALLNQSDRASAVRSWRFYDLRYHTLYENFTLADSQSQAAKLLSNITKRTALANLTTPITFNFDWFCAGADAFAILPILWDLHHLESSQ